MNTSSPKKIFISLAVLVLAIVAIYFSLNKNISIPTNNVDRAATTSTDGKPVITKFDIPTGLNVNQNGTWVLYASSTDGGELKYSALWGDEIIKDSNDAFVPFITSSSTFNHTYSYPGVYNPVLTVYGKNGKSVYASIGIRVLGDIGTKPPIVYSLSPSSATAGELVTINGAGFMAPMPVKNGVGSVPSNEVLFDGKGLGGVTSNGINNLYFIIPNDAKPGKHTVEVKNPNGKSNSVNVIVTTINKNTL